jgi:hypothetical protein
MPFPVLPRRVRTDRADGKGFFAQHPQFSNHWYEVDDKEHVYGYTEVELVKEGEEFILQDKSTPRRADVFVRIVVGVKAEMGKSKQGPWSTWIDLRACDPADGCVYIPEYETAGRKVFKFKVRRRRVTFLSYIQIGGVYGRDCGRTSVVRVQR